MKGKNDLQKTQTSTQLDIVNPNHILYKYDKLNFEIRGGINHENYQSLRVMLVTSYNRNKHRDNVDLLNNDQRNTYILKVAETTQLHREKVKQAFEELTNQLEEYKLELQYNYGKPTLKSHQLSDTDREQAIDILKQPDLLTHINTLIDEAGLMGNRTNRIILFLTYLTRKTNTSLHAIIQSQHNYLQNKLSQLIPEEEKIVISHISDNALFYFNEEELQNKIVLVEDTLTNRKSLLPLLGFQNNNLVTKTTVIKNEYAELITIQKHVKGNLSLSISTPEEQAFTQNRTLSFVIHEETGKCQDEKVVHYQRKQSAGLVCPYKEQHIITQIQNLQRVLSPITVINPYAMEINLPEQIKNKQITNLHYLRFIEVITFLKQHQRTRQVNTDTGEEYIQTTLEDIKEANTLLSEILVNKSDVLNKPTRLYIEQLKIFLATHQTQSQTFTLHDISIALQIPKTTLVRYTQTLVETGLVAIAHGDKKSGYHYQLINPDEYTELKTKINTAMNNNITNIEQLTNSKPQTTANQNQSGTPNTLKPNTLLQVNHNPEGGIEAATKKTNHIKINTKNKAA